MQNQIIFFKEKKIKRISTLRVLPKNPKGQFFGNTLRVQTAQVASLQNNSLKNFWKKLKKHQLFPFFFLYFLPLWGLGGCTTPEPFGDIQVKVLDNFGFPVSNAKVTLYANLNDFNTETNAIRNPQNTDQNGITNFFDLRNQLSDSCYVDIISPDGIRNNWEGKSKIPFIKTENGFRNLGEFVVFDSRTGVVANAQGKGWQWSRVKNNSVDITNTIQSCEMDNIYYFFKGGKYIKDEGSTKCQTSNPQTNTGIWSFNDSNTGFNINLNNNINEWIFIAFSNNSFQVSQNIVLNSIVTNVEITYTKVP